MDVRSELQQCHVTSWVPWRPYTMPYVTAIIAIHMAMSHKYVLLRASSQKGYASIYLFGSSLRDGRGFGPISSRNASRAPTSEKDKLISNPLIHRIIYGCSPRLLCSFRPN
eukprot:1352775-Amorphochlora_amoeboformis.AAC.2